jgi:hypothetical protein
MSEISQRTLRGFWIAILLALLCLGLACSKKESTEEEAKTTEAQQAQKAQVVQAYGKLPLTFTENRGQVAEPVRFYIRGPRGTVYYTPEEVVYDVVERTGEERERRPHEDRQELARPDTTVRRKGVVVRMKLEEANASVILEGVDEQEGKVNIFRGKDRSQWKTGIRTFGGIVYRDLYPGIDLSYHGRDGRLSPELTVNPGAKPEKIAFRYEGAEKIQIDREGSLRIETALGTITDPKPFCYQEKKGQKVEVKGEYRMLAENTVGFEVGKYDKKQPLFISIGAQ